MHDPLNIPWAQKHSRQCIKLTLYQHLFHVSWTKNVQHMQKNPSGFISLAFITRTGIKMARHFSYTNIIHTDTHTHTQIPFSISQKRLLLPDYSFFTFGME